MKRIEIPGVGVFEYPNETPDEFIYQDVDRRLLEMGGYPTQPIAPVTAPPPEPPVSEAVTPVMPTEEAPKQATFGDLFFEQADNILELGQSLKYGITGEDSAAQALMKAQSVEGETTGFTDIKSGKDFLQWAKQTVAGTGGFIATPATAAITAGAVSGPFAGVVAPATFFSVLFGQYLVNNLGEQATADRERADRGEQKTGPSILKAGAAGAGSVALDYLGLRLFKPIAKLLGASGTKEANSVAKGVIDKTLGRNAANKVAGAATKIDNSLANLITPKVTESGIKTVAKGAGVGAGVEAVQEVAQTVLERAQAGRSLTDKEAMNAYIEAMAGGILIGAPLGSITRSMEKSGVRKAEDKAEAETTLQTLQQTQTTEQKAALKNINKVLSKLDRKENVSEADLDATLNTAGIDAETVTKLDLEDTYQGKINLLKDLQPRLANQVGDIKLDFDDINVIKPTKQQITKRQDITWGQLKVPPPQGKKETDAVKWSDLDSNITWKDKKKTIDPDANLKWSQLRSIKVKESEVKDADAKTTGASMAVPGKSGTGKDQEAPASPEGPDAGKLDDVTPRTDVDQTGPGKVDTPITPVDLKPAKFVKFNNYKEFRKGIQTEQGLKANQVTKYLKDNKLPINKQEFDAVKEQEVETLVEKGPIQDKVQELVKAGAAIESADNKVVKYKLKPNQKTKVARVDKLQPVQVDDATKGDLISKIDETLNQKITSDNITEVTGQLRTLANEIGAKVPELTINNADTKSFNKLQQDLKATKQSLQKDRVILSKETKQDIAEAEQTKTAEENIAKNETVRDTQAATFQGVFNQLGDNTVSNYLGAVFDKLGELPGKIKDIALGLVPPERLAKYMSLAAKTNQQLATALNNYRNAILNLSNTFDRYMFGARSLGQRLSNYMIDNRKNEKSIKLNNLMNDSSLYNVDVSRGKDYFENLDTERKTYYRRLRPIYESMDPEAQTLYRDLGDYERANYQRYIQSAEKTIDALAENATQKKELQEEVRNVFKNKPPLDYYTSFRRTGNYWILWEQNGELVKTSAETQREADRIVKALGKQRGVSEPRAFKSDKEIADNLNKIQAPAAFKKLLNLIDKDIQSGKIDKDSVEGQTRTALKEQFTSFFIKNLPQNAIALSALTRDKTLGFASQSVDKVFNAQALAKAKQLASLDSALQVENALNELNAAIDPITDSKQRNALLAAKNAFRANFNLILNPSVGGLNTVANFFGRAGFYYYLTSYASAMINLFQTPTMAASIMRGKYKTAAVYQELMNTGLEILGDNISKGIAKDRKTTTFTYAQLYGRTNNPALDNRKYVIPLPTTLTKTEERELAKAYVENIIENNQIISQSGASLDINRRDLTDPKFTPTGNITKAASTILFGAFGGTETLNKEVTFLAALRLANKDRSKLKTGEKFDSPYDYAKEVTRESHGDYSYANSGAIFKSPTGRSLLMFKKYPVLMLTNWAMAMRKSIANLEKQGFTAEETKAIRLEARRQLLGMVSTGLVTSGVAYALPLGFAAQFIINLFLSDDDDPDNPYKLDAEKNVENFMASALGTNMPAFDTELGRIVWTGPLENLTQAKVAERSGVGAGYVKLPYQGLGEAEFWFQFVGGPLGGLGVSALNAYKDFANGNPDRALEAMLPSSLRNIAKSIRVDEEKLQSRTGYGIADLSPYEQVLLFLGFTPKDLDKIYGINTAARDSVRKLADKRGDLLTDLDRLTMRQTNIISRMMLTVLYDSPADINELMEDVDKFNKEAIASNGLVKPITLKNMGESLSRKAKDRFINDAYGLGGYVPTGTWQKYGIINMRERLKEFSGLED